MKKLILIFLLVSFKVYGQGSGSPCGDTLLCTGCDVGLDCLGISPVCLCGIPLPIELTDFNAKQVDNKIELNWTTASEINNDYFTIERALDGINYIEIGRVKGSGNSNTTLHYTFIDSTPMTGYNYYRLKQTDYDGKFEYSGLIVVNNIQDNSSPNFFPNPFSTQTVLQTDNLLDNATLTVINSCGQTVKQIKNITGQTVTLFRDNLPNGLYFLRLTDNKTFYADKLVITD